MMLLLDSQAVLWVLDDSPRLGERARETIAAATRVHVSAATVWELTIKSMLGKLSLPVRLSGRLADQRLSLLNIIAEHAGGIREFPELVRRDPFDRLLVAQASQASMRLVTADRVLLGLGRDRIVDAIRLTGKGIGPAGAGPIPGWGTAGKVASRWWPSRPRR